MVSNYSGLRGILWVWHPQGKETMSGLHSTQQKVPCLTTVIPEGGGRDFHHFA